MESLELTIQEEAFSINLRHRLQVQSGSATSILRSPTLCDDHSAQHSCHLGQVDSMERSISACCPQRHTRLCDFRPASRLHSVLHFASRTGNTSLIQAWYWAIREFSHNSLTTSIEDQGLESGHVYREGALLVPLIISRTLFASSHVRARLQTAFPAWDFPSDPFGFHAGFDLVIFYLLSVSLTGTSNLRPWRRRSKEGSEAGTLQRRTRRTPLTKPALRPFLPPTRPPRPKTNTHEDHHKPTMKLSTTLLLLSTTQLLSVSAAHRGMLPPLSVPLSPQNPF